MKEHVWIASRNRRLSAMVHVPALFNDQTPVIVCCHGFTGDKVGYNQVTLHLANALEASGYGVIRFDFLGSGDSDGDFAVDTRVSGWKEDLANVLLWVRRQPRFAASPLLLYGHSLGGLVALTHSDPRREIAARIVFAPVTDPITNFREIILGEDLWQQALQGQQIANFFNKFFKLNSQFVADLIAGNYDPVKAMREGAAPLLLIHGTLDVIVPIQHSRKFYDNYNGIKEFKELSLEHSAESNQELLQTAVVEWLKRQFPIPEDCSSQQ